MSLFPSCIVDIFSTPGAAVWTKRAGATRVKIQGMGGGAGGQGGGCAAPGGTIAGGPGGNGASWCEMSFIASVLGATENVSVGAGGTGSAAATVSGTAPSDGFSASGTQSTVGVFFYAPPGGQGSAGFQPHLGIYSRGPNPAAQPATAPSFGTDGGIGGSALFNNSESVLGAAAGGNGGGITAGVAQTGIQGGRGGGTQNTVPKTAGRNTIVGGGTPQGANSTVNGGA